MASDMRPPGEMEMAKQIDLSNYPDLSVQTQDSALNQPSA